MSHFIFRALAPFTLEFKFIKLAKGVWWGTKNDLKSYDRLWRIVKRKVKYMWQSVLPTSKRLISISVVLMMLKHILIDSYDHKCEAMGTVYTIRHKQQCIIIIVDQMNITCCRCDHLFLTFCHFHTETRHKISNISSFWNPRMHLDNVSIVFL